MIEMKITWSPLAHDRAADIVDYISRDKPSAAKKWLASVFSKIELLISSPELGRVVPETNDIRIRELLHGNYRIIYRIEPDQISILTIRHGHQILSAHEIEP